MNYDVLVIYLFIALGVCVRYFVAYHIKIVGQKIVLYKWQDFFTRMNAKYIYSAILAFLSAVPADLVLNFQSFPLVPSLIFGFMYGLGGLTLLNFVLKYYEKVYA